MIGEWSGRSPAHRAAAGGKRRDRPTPKQYADLSRKQVGVLATALEAALLEHGTQAQFARSLSWRSSAMLSNIADRPSALRMEIGMFRALAAGLRLDVSEWDVLDTR